VTASGRLEVKHGTSGRRIGRSGARCRRISKGSGTRVGTILRRRGGDFEEEPYTWPMALGAQEESATGWAGEAIRLEFDHGSLRALLRGWLAALRRLM
jgi:hypothetical protein